MQNFRVRNLRGYVDARDVAQSCRLEAGTGAGKLLIIAAADTVMETPQSRNRPMAEVSGRGVAAGGRPMTLYSGIDKARRWATTPEFLSLRGMWAGKA